MRNEDLRIGGDRVATAERTDVTNPYTGALIGTVARGTGADLARAIAAAAAALAGGSQPQHERAAVLERAGVLVEERAGDLARCLAEEAGKPVTTARAEVARCADTLRFSAVEARTLAGDVVPFAGSSAGAGKIGFTLLRPVGVVAAITPFNFPLNLVCHKLAPAFAAGCPVVLKPAGDTPFSAYALAQILEDAGMRPNMLSVVTGPSSELGPVIDSAEEVAVISFTGSTEVGRGLAERNPRKKVLMELGNTTPVLVDATADLQRAASRLAATAFAFAGQSCISAQRVYVARDVHNAFLDLLVPAVDALVVGDPLDAATDVGPLIRPDDRDRVVAWIAEAVADGASVRTSGQVNPDGTLQPTVLAEVTAGMKVSAREVFGPVLAVQAVATLDEAIDLANATPYGLQAGIFTGDLAAALSAAQRLRFGGVTVNESPTFRADQQPYGGSGDSGNTREGPAFAVREYLESTTVILQT